MRRSRILFLFFCCLAVPLGLWAQGNTMGTISGKVIDPEGLAIPGVTITVESASLQGSRTTTTSVNGDYVLPLLPAGDYVLTFELTGFATVKHSQRVTPGETTVLPATRLVLASVSETVNVVGKVENFAQTAAAATSLKSDFVQKLPTSRNVLETVLLAPGVNNTGPSSAVTIGGALLYEGLYLVNGVVVNENLRGQPLNLFVEDAVQETTTTTGSVSAEYGRFAGGVVNTITKSGGNSFSGSFRDALANDAWRSVTPFGEPKTDKTVPTYTYTVGGPIWRDKLWFFHAGRYTKTATSMMLPYSGLPLDQNTKEYRFEETLRYTLTPSHNFRATFFNLSSEQNNYRFGGMDLRQIYDRRLPQSMQSFNYNAILSSRLFLELQYSQRDLAWEKDGSRFTDRIKGTQLQDRSRTTYWSPTFCGVCTNEERNNQDVLAKASYFLSTSKTGSHNLVLGADVFRDYRFSNNHQSGSDFIVASPRSIQVGADFYPVFTNDGLTLISYRPILVPTKGTNIWTYSAFFNDAWRLNNHFSFNVGVRWDRNRSVDSSGAEVAEDTSFSPRLSATWDPRGDGKTTFFASYARYVAAMANSIADAGSAGGQPALFQWIYRGPTVNADGANLLPDAALPILFNWWDAQGGAANTNLNSVSIPGLTTKIAPGLKSQYMTEYLAGMSHNFGRVLVRVDASYRPASNFYGNFTSLETGQVTNPATGAAADLTLVKNTDSVWRRYWGVNGQVSWRARRDLVAGANWTISRNQGSVEGENAGAGPIRTAADQVPRVQGPVLELPRRRPQLGPAAPRADLRQLRPSDRGLRDGGHRRAPDGQQRGALRRPRRDRHATVRHEPRLRDRAGRIDRQLLLHGARCLPPALGQPHRLLAELLLQGGAPLRGLLAGAAAERLQRAAPGHARQRQPDRDDGRRAGVDPGTPALQRVHDRARAGRALGARPRDEQQGRAREPGSVWAGARVRRLPDAPDLPYELRVPLLSRSGHEFGKRAWRGPAAGRPSPRAYEESARRVLRRSSRRPRFLPRNPSACLAAPAQLSQRFLRKPESNGQDSRLLAP